MKKIKLAIFGSGSGTTAEAIYNACQEGGGLAGLVEVALVIVNRDRGMPARCIEAGMAPENVLVMQRQDYVDSTAWWRAIVKECKQREVEVIGLHGFLKRVPKWVLRRFKHVLNQHPGPLDPGYLDLGGDGMYGKRVHQLAVRIYEATGGAFAYTEATIQIADENYDTGMIVGRYKLAIRPDHTPESLAADLLPIEHRLAIQTYLKLAAGRLVECVRATRLILPQQEEQFRSIRAHVLAGD